MEIDFSAIIIKFKNEETEHSITAADINGYNDKKFQRRGVYELGHIRHVIENMLIRSFDIDILDEDDIFKISRKISSMTDIPFSITMNYVSDYIQNREFSLSRRTNKVGLNGLKKIEQLSLAIDNNLSQQIHYFTTYRRIENDFSKLLSREDKFDNREMLIRFGMSDVEKSIKIILTNIAENSRESFNKMAGVLLKQYASIDAQKTQISSSQIDKSMLRIILDRLGNEIAEEDRMNIISLLDNKKMYEPKYSYLLDLILKLIDNYDKQRVFDDKIKKFANTCNKYLNGKKFFYNQSELKLPVHLLFDNDEQGDEISLTKLSSGEKQIVSLFSKLYLENDKDCILIIDEPELSLSMAWQKILLPDIMRSGNCKLLFAVTHSPFIFENEFDHDAKEIRSCITSYAKKK